ncbi:cell wall protein IFF6-like [Hyposmocoma kahamanoa]|uniref:cell wall protein IFF6-like n=1 Tax=Hyposmocoma kahamanoa TaxID=1477025 RepID=UPI000E6D89D6|nr:cell wall protein IFF6-like [Hyposmocoma kahamanoa]
MSTTILVIWALIVLASTNDIILINDNAGQQALDAKYEASPAIWRQEKNVTFQASNGEIINKIVVTDMRPDKDGVAAIVAGGIGQDNVVIQLQSPTLLRGFDYRVQIFTIARNIGRSNTTTTTTAPQRRTLSVTGHTEEKDNTTEILRNTINTANHPRSLLPTVKKTSESPKHIATFSMTDQTAQTKSNAVQSKDDNEDQNTSENGNINTSKIKADSFKSEPNDGKGVQSTEKPRRKRDTPTITNGQQDLTNQWNNKNQNISAQPEKPKQDGPSTLSPSSLRRIGDPQDKFDETGTHTTQSEEGFRKLSTTQTPRRARNVKVKNIESTTTKPKPQNLNTSNKSEEQTGVKLRTLLTSSTENNNDVKDTSTTPAPKSRRGTVDKNIESATTKPIPQNFNTSNKSEEQTGVKLRTFLKPSTENNNDVKDTSTISAPKSRRGTEVKHFESTTIEPIIPQNVNTSNKPNEETDANLPIYYYKAEIEELKTTYN